MITFYFVRHGETIWNNMGRYQGVSDVKLSARGVIQSHMVADYFSEIQVDCIFSSDLSRAINTATPLAGKKGLEVFLEPGLREINFGQWEGLTYEEIEARWPGAINDMYQFPSKVKIEGGQSFLDLQQQAMKTMRKIIAKHDDKNIVIFSHGGTIRCIVCALLNLPLDYAWNFKQDNVNVTIVQYFGKRNLLALLNDTHHVKSRFL